MDAKGHTWVRRIGSVHGPMNKDNLSGCIPTILAGCPGLNFEDDIQILYRFPILPSLHAFDLCNEEFWKETDETGMVLALQTQENAQAGYVADLQNKRSAQSFNDIQEAKTSHHALADKILD